MLAFLRSSGLVIDEFRFFIHHLNEVRNFAACIFFIWTNHQVVKIHFKWGLKVDQWMETNPDFHSLRRDFLIFFEKTLKRDDGLLIPNPFQGGAMLAEKVNRWIAEFKAEGKAEGIAEGEVIGKLEEWRTLLRRMRDFGMSITEITQITGLSEDEIQHMI